MLILAACTQSKRGSILPQRRLRSHSSGGEAGPDVANEWSRALAAHPGEALHVEKLYKGAYWSAVLGLRNEVSANRLAVVSAGLGLIDGASSQAPYSATFGNGHDDSVPAAGTANGRAAWWRLLGGSQALRTAIYGADRVVVVLPNRYLDVVADDLIAGDRGQVVVFAASAPARLREHCGPRLVPLESRMVRRLGTNVGALAPRAASYLVTRAGGTTDIKGIHRFLSELSLAEEPPLYPVRARQSRDQVVAWLEAARRGPAPPSSATAALRRFRDSGLAFEQQRFHRLYRATRESWTELP